MFSFVRPSLRRLPGTLLRQLGLLAVCVLAGWLALSAVYALPTEPIRQNLLSSVDKLQQEGNYPLPLFGSRLDNYTDGIELGAAVFPAQGSPLTASLRGSYYIGSGEGPLDTLARYCKQGSQGLTERSYNYYWHGYLVFLKPFLYLFQFSLFRELGPLLVLLLICANTLLFCRAGLPWLALPYWMAMAVLSPMAVGVSLQFSPVFYIANGAVAAALLWHAPLSRRRLWPFFFVVVGALTSYTDLLTAPLMTLGLPLVAVLILCGPQQVWQRLWQLVGLGLSWALGYLGMWAGKWLLGTLFLGENVFSTAFAEILYRTSTANELAGEAPNTLLGAELANLGELLSYSFDLVLLAGLAVCLVRLWQNRRALCPARLLQCLPLGVLALSPLAWYAVTINHSATHYWFTYRSLSILIFAGYAVLMALGQPAPWPKTAEKD